MYIMAFGQKKTTRFFFFLKREIIFYKVTIPGLSCNKTATQYFPDLDAKNCLSPDESVDEQ